jgi:hypothetical protein
LQHVVYRCYRHGRSFRPKPRHDPTISRRHCQRHHRSVHPPSSGTNNRIVFAWKLGLVALALMPVQVCAGYARFVMQKKLTQALRKAYARSADIACEQVAAIRTVVSLNREPHILKEFEESLKQPVHDAMMKTLKSTGVCVSMTNANGSSFTLSHWATCSFRSPFCFGMAVRCWPPVNAT